jgi:hypothetical protein
MVTPNTHQLGTLPTAHSAWLQTASCGHPTHVGTCAECQRRQMAKWAAQLEEATERARDRRAAIVIE